ncbi:MAG: lipopolysaccharide biosynthesis protein [Flavobacteriales bacterium]|nr:lipopolysaccharide biosynthesis protein [Flavobacteriales bacterium]
MRIPEIGGFKRNVMTLMGGSALAQVIPLIATPFLTRMYSPEQFGALAVLLAIANPLSLLVCGRYEMTVVLPKEDREARPLVQASLFVALLVTALLGALIWTFRDLLVGCLGVSGPGVGVAVVLSPLLFHSMGSFQPLNNWLVRKEAFAAMSFNRIVQTSTITIASLLMGRWALENGLMYGYLAGWGLYLGMGLVQAEWKDARIFRINTSLIKAGMRNYRHFPLYNALPAVLNTATLSIPVFALTRLFDEEVTGQFNLSRQSIFLPGMFIASAFMQVYMQRSSATVSAGLPVGPGLSRLVRFLSFFGVALALVLITLGPFLFAVVFGEEWEQAGSMARVLAVPFALQFVVVPLAVVLPALGRIKAYSVWQVIYFSSVLVISFVPMQGPDMYVMALAVVESLCFLSLAIYLFRAVQWHDTHLAEAR